MGEPFAAITEIWARATAVEILTAAAIVSLLATLVSLAVDYFQLRRDLANREAELHLATVGKDSTNWEDAAQELERKTEDPSLAARSTAMTHLHMLEQAANAWRRASKWEDALRVTQQLLIECSHVIMRPTINQDDFLAVAHLIEEVLEKYPDLSKAANEHADNAIDFLNDRVSILSVQPNSKLVGNLRDRLVAARTAIEGKKDGKSKAD